MGSLSHPLFGFDEGAPVHTQLVTGYQPSGNCGLGDICFHLTLFDVICETTIESGMFCHQ